MTYNLKPHGANGSLLEITQGDFSTVADGQRRYKDSLDGDDTVLNGIKKIAEAEAMRN
jgi:hypothetical protein